jgi:hypothetical protein
LYQQTRFNGEVFDCAQLLAVADYEWKCRTEKQINLTNLLAKYLLSLE